MRPKGSVASGRARQKGRAVNETEQPTRTPLCSVCAFPLRPSLCRLPSSPRQHRCRWTRCCASLRRPTWLCRFTRGLWKRERVAAGTNGTSQPLCHVKTHSLSCLVAPTNSRQTIRRLAGGWRSVSWAGSVSQNSFCGSCLRRRRPE